MLSILPKFFLEKPRRTTTNFSRIEVIEITPIVISATNFIQLSSHLPAMKSVLCGCQGISAIELHFWHDNGLAGDAILLLHFMLEYYRFDFDGSRSNVPYWVCFRIYSNGNLDKTFHLMLFAIDFYAGQFFDLILCKLSIEHDEQKKYGDKMFQMQPTSGNVGIERWREREKKCYTKIDFTCKSLFDSNAVDTCRISFSHSEYIFYCNRMAFWHCQTRCHENRIFRTDTHTHTAHTFLTS